MTTRCDERQVNNRDDDRKKRGRKEKNNRESCRGGGVNDQTDSKRKSYSEAVIGGTLRRERVFMGNSKDRQDIRQRRKVVVCLPGARIEHGTERVENI